MLKKVYGKKKGLKLFIVFYHEFNFQIRGKKMCLKLKYFFKFIKLFDSPAD